MFCFFFRQNLTVATPLYEQSYREKFIQYFLFNTVHYDFY